VGQQVFELTDTPKLAASATSVLEDGSGPVDLRYPLDMPQNKREEREPLLIEYYYRNAADRSDEGWVTLAHLQDMMTAREAAGDGSAPSQSGNVSNSNLFRDVLGVRWTYYDVPASVLPGTKSYYQLDNVALVGVGRYEDVRDAHAGWSEQPNSWVGSMLADAAYTHHHNEATMLDLHSVGADGSLVPAITDAEGQFQNSTRSAVAKFQSIFNLASDGIVGKATWYKLSQLYTAVTRLAELSSEGTSPGIGTIPPSSVLRQGARGQDVVTLQYLLNVASEFYPGIPAPAQDGIFGAGTKQAVTAFQQMVQLNPDGIVGPLTWQTLYDVYHGIHENVPSPSPNPDTVQYVVKAGDSLWLIAQKYGTTVDAIKNLNGLTSDVLNIGQVLKIPTQGALPYIEYTVRSGDSLWLIARRYNTTVDEIRRLNGLTSNLLNIGQVLRIPVG